VDIVNDLREGNLTARERKWVEEARSEILQVVEEFVPATDARRIEQDLDTLIQFLVKKGGS
jgi:hypothetical protein